MWRISRNEKVHMEWTGDIIPQDFKDEFYYHNHHTHLYLQKEQLKEISKDIDIPITWYEDLYAQDRMESFNIINKWDIDDIDPFELNEYLHPKNKLKKSDKKSMI